MLETVHLHLQKCYETFLRTKEKDLVSMEIADFKGTIFEWIAKVQT